MAGRARPGAARWLRILVVVVALVVVAAGATLGLVKAGVIDKTGTGSPKATPGGTAAKKSASSKVPLVTQVSTGAGTATYRVDIAAYAVTVATTTGRSWVSIGAAGNRRLRGDLEPRPVHRRSSFWAPPRWTSARAAPR